MWKGRNLSFTGRVCLIKSVVNVIPLFYLSFFKAPVGVCKEITKLQRIFLWGWGKKERKLLGLVGKTYVNRKRRVALPLKYKFV